MSTQRMHQPYSFSINFHSFNKYAFTGSVLDISYINNNNNNNKPQTCSWSVYNLVEKADIEYVIKSMIRDA